MLDDGKNGHHDAERSTPPSTARRHDYFDMRAILAIIYFDASTADATP